MAIRLKELSPEHLKRITSEEEGVLFEWTDPLAMIREPRPEPTEEDAADARRRAEEAMRKAQAEARQRAEGKPPGTTGDETSVKPVWTLDIPKMVIPDTKVSGSIHGQPFALDGTKLTRGGSLELLEGKEHFPDRSVTIHLFPEEGETLPGKTYVTLSDERVSVPHVRIKWQEPGSRFGGKETFTHGYAMVLQFGECKRGQLPGMIYLCLPDESRSVIAGTFSVEIFDATHREVTQTEIGGDLILRGGHKDLQVNVARLTMGAQTRRNSALILNLTGSAISAIGRACLDRLVANAPLSDETLKKVIAVSRAAETTSDELSGRTNVRVEAVSPEGVLTPYRNAVKGKAVLGDTLPARHVTMFRLIPVRR